MKASDWAAQSQKKWQKRTLPQASRHEVSQNFKRYLANFRAALADRNYPYGAVMMLADTDRISPMYNPYARAVNRWCVFGADGWEIEQSNNLH